MPATFILQITDNQVFYFLQLTPGSKIPFSLILYVVAAHPRHSSSDTVRYPSRSKRRPHEEVQ